MQEGVGVERAQRKTRVRRGAVGGIKVGAPPAYDAGMVHQAEGEKVAGAVEGRGSGGRKASRLTHDDREWASSGAPVNVAPFTEVVGPNFTVQDDPASTFLMLYTPELLEHVVTETNHFASLCSMESEGMQTTAWTTSTDEMKAFIGFVIMMGVVKLPDLYDYGSSSEVPHCFPVASRITRKRFLELRQYLHFVDNDALPVRGEEGYDHLGKVRPVQGRIQGGSMGCYSTPPPSG